MKNFVIFIFVFCTSVIFAEMTLPVYYLSIDQEYLDLLEEDPTSDVYYPAVFTYEGIDYPCEARYRGQSSLVMFPQKRNWKIKFDDDDSPFNKEKINLNAEYADKSMMRNYLVMKFYQEMGFPSADVVYRNLVVNGVHRGLFVQVENMDEEFLEDHNLPEGDLYKAKNHGANTAPLVEYRYYERTWEKNSFENTGYDDWQEFLYWLYFSSKNDFDEQIASKAEVDNILNFFAINFSLSSTDCFTKNMFFYHNNETDKYMIFPWDNDGSFGNQSPEGTYENSYTTLETHNNLEHNTIFRRLMDNEQYYVEFWNKVEEIRTVGFDYFHSKIDSTYLEIKEDFYFQPDSIKVCTNTEFDEEMNVLHNFLNERSAFLDGFENFASSPLQNYYVYNEFPTNDNPIVEFKVESIAPQGVLIIYAYNINFDEFGASFDYATCHLFDDGEHNDFLANDLIYGNYLDTSDLPEGLIVYSYINYESSSQLNSAITDFKNNLRDQLNFIKEFDSPEKWSYPYNGIFYLSYYKNVMLALNKTQIDSNEYNDLTFENFFMLDDDYFIEIKNNSLSELDLSYCFVNYKDYYRNFIIPQNNVLQSEQSLIITSNKEFAESYFGDALIVDGLYFDLEVGYEIKLLSPSLNEIISTEIQEIDTFVSDENYIVINEINYNSADDFDPKDWIELTNNSLIMVDLSGWKFQDSDDSHEFIIPENTFIPEGGYLVLAKNIEEFQSFFPDVENVIGDFDFGLSGSGELLRLYDENGLLVDSVEYSDEAPWDDLADGNGPTLELRNPALDNNLAENWSASENHGTPGLQNSNFVVSNDTNPAPIILSLYNSPNPFNPKTTINFSLNKKGKVDLSIYNIKGQRVVSLVDEELSFGNHHIVWEGKDKNNKDISSGIYFYKLIIDNDYRIKKCILLK